MRVPTTDNGDRIYAIGDVHGRYDLLCRIFEKIEAHSATLPPNRNTNIILLGDLIDRGPQSAQVLEFLFNLQKRNKNFTVLLGNHEELMIRAISGEPGMLRAWIKLGGGRHYQAP